MKSRHRAREIALQILYRHDLLQQQAGPVLPKSPEQASNDLRQHFEHFKVAEELQPFIHQLVMGTLHHLPSIDAVIEKHAANWKLSRINTIDRCLLRTATYEMLYLNQETAPSIIIDEAIELAKTFGTTESSSFINGILDSIKNQLHAGDTSSGSASAVSVA